MTNPNLDQDPNALRLHLGCGNRHIPGFINIDIQNFDAVDIIADISKLDIFRDNKVDLIYSCANIEHFGRHEWKNIVKEWYRVLKPGGILRISTADFSQCVQRYQKEEEIEELLGLIIGGQKDAFDRHGMIFDFKYLQRSLKELGFSDIKRYDWRETITGKLDIDDYSRSYLPHMDFEHGKHMMLNVEARK